MPNSPDPHFTEDEAESLGPIVDLDGESEISPSAPNSAQPSNQSPPSPHNKPNPSSLRKP